MHSELPVREQVIQNSINSNIMLALREWRFFLRSKAFLIAGVAVPVVLAISLVLAVVSLPKQTTDSINRWQYFQSELKRFGYEVNGTHTFERSDHRKLFYVVDDTDLKIGASIQQEILKRDLASLIDFLKNTRYNEWTWFDEPKKTGYSSPSQLQSAISRDDFTAEELISMYALEHDSTFTSRLSTSDSNHSWFVDGWNDHIGDIAESIPWMSFARFVQVNVQREEWTRSRWVTGYFELPAEFLDSFQAHFFVASPPRHGFEELPHVDSTRTLRDWYLDLIATMLLDSNSQAEGTSQKRVYRNQFDISQERANSLSNFDELRSNTQYQSKLFYTLIIFLAFVWVWCLLFFDPNLKPRTEVDATESLSSVADGRVLGMTISLVTVALTWFVLLIVPGSLFIGMNPSLGIGALVEFFHPLFLVHCLIVLLLGLLSWGYVLHTVSLFHRIWAATLFLLLFLVVAISVEQTFRLFGEVGVYPYLPLTGPIAMIKLTFGEPNLVAYSVALLLAILYAIGMKLCCNWIERRSLLTGELKHHYHPK